METLTITDLGQTTIGEIVARDYRTAELFKKYKIDFCCGGKRKLVEVIREKGLSVNAVVAELHEMTSNPQRGSQNYTQWEPDFLMDYIVNTHHRYLKSAIPTLLMYAKKVAAVHGKEHPEVIEVAKVFEQLANDLDPHLLKEEEILFPYIRQMSNARHTGQMLPEAHFGTVNNPLRVMEHEHDTAGELMRVISELTNHYTPPADACNTYRVLYAGLREFEDDLHQHVHLENNILFKKAAELEEAEKG